MYPQTRNGKSIQGYPTQNVDTSRGPVGAQGIERRQRVSTLVDASPETVGAQGINRRHPLSTLRPKDHLRPNAHTDEIDQPHRPDVTSMQTS